MGDEIQKQLAYNDFCILPSAIYPNNSARDMMNLAYKVINSSSVRKPSFILFGR